MNFTQTNKIIKLSEEDRKNLVELYEKLINGEDWASRAWDKVRNEMDELGNKYGFDPKKMRGINTETGEVYI